jgi:hypothetical protein
MSNPTTAIIDIDETIKFTIDDVVTMGNKTTVTTTVTFSAELTKSAQEFYNTNYYSIGCSESLMKIKRLEESQELYVNRMLLAHVRVDEEKRLMEKRNPQLKTGNAGRDEKWNEWTALVVQMRQPLIYLVYHVVDTEGKVIAEPYQHERMKISVDDLLERKKFSIDVRDLLDHKKVSLVLVASCEDGGTWPQYQEDDPCVKANALNSESCKKDIKSFVIEMDVKAPLKEMKTIDHEKFFETEGMIDFVVKGEIPRDFFRRMLVGDNAKLNAIVAQYEINIYEEYITATYKGKHKQEPLLECSYNQSGSNYMSGPYVLVPSKYEEGFAMCMHCAYKYSANDNWVVINDERYFCDCHKGEPSCKK